MGEWQPIETAPDVEADLSKRVLTYSPVRGVELRLADGAWWRMRTKEGSTGHPTHWMPLPPPPTGEGE